MNNITAHYLDYIQENKSIEDQKKELKDKITDIRKKIEKLKSDSPQYKFYSDKLIKYASKLKYLNKFKIKGKVGSVIAVVGGAGKILSIHKKVSA